MDKYQKYLFSLFSCVYKFEIEGCESSNYSKGILIDNDADNISERYNISKEVVQKAIKYCNDLTIDHLRRQVQYSQLQPRLEAACLLGCAHRRLLQSAPHLYK